MSCYEIERLIPQRDPIKMVDHLIGVEGETAVTVLTVRADNYFLTADGTLAEPGLIEHIAQSASAFAGYQALGAGAENPPVGYIGEIKNFHCHRCPCVGEELQTAVTMGDEVAGITLVYGETRVGEELIADTRMKIFIAHNG